MPEAATIVIASLLTNQKSQARPGHTLLERRAGLLRIRFGRPALAADFRSIDTDQPHPPTIAQFQRIAIDDISTDYRLACPRHPAAGIGQRRRDQQPGNKKGAPTERLFRIRHCHLRGLSIFTSWW